MLLRIPSSYWQVYVVTHISYIISLIFPLPSLNPFLRYSLQTKQIRSPSSNLILSNHFMTPYWNSSYIQLDLGYSATSYPDISIIRLRSGSVYCLLFINFHIKSCSKQKQSQWFSVLYFILFSFYLSDNLLQIYTRAMNKYIITCIHPTELAVFKH